MPLILPGNVASATAAAYDVANSCRFNDGDSPRHQKDFADGHDTAATISLWFKRCTNSAAQTLFECFEDASNYLSINGGFDGFCSFVDDLNQSLNIPKKLSGLGIDNPDIERIVSGALKDPSTGGNPIKMTPENTRELLSDII